MVKITKEFMHQLNVYHEVVLLLDGRGSQRQFMVEAAWDELNRIALNAGLSHLMPKKIVLYDDGQNGRAADIYALARQKWLW